MPQPHHREDGGQEARPFDRAPPSRSLALWAAAVILGAGVLVYANSLSGPFIFDDLNSIVENTAIRRFWPLEPLLTKPSTTVLINRPVVSISLAANYALHGLDVRGYHLFNVAVHFLAALALFGVIRRTLTGPPLRERFGPAAPWIAGITALIWVVHPLQTEAVTYVVQRTELLMGLFYLLTLYCAIRGFESPRGRVWHAAAVGCCALGMGSKEVMVSAPLIVLLYDRTFVSASWRQALNRHGSLYIGLAATWAVLAGLMLASPRNATVGFHLPISSTVYLRTQTGVIFHYLRLAVWPAGLVISYDDWPLAVAARDFLPQGLVILAVLAGTLWVLRCRSPLGFLGAWFFLILAPTSSFLPIVSEIAAERRMYLPLAAIVVLAVVGGYDLLGRLSTRPTPGERTLSRAYSPVPMVMFGMAVLVAIPLGLATIRRNQDYRTRLAIWTATVNQRPANAAAHGDLAQALIEAGRPQAAFRHFFEAIRLKPYDPRIHNNLGLAWASQGRLEDAIAEYREALRLQRDFPEAHNNLGTALAGRHQLDEAEQQYREAIGLKPTNAQAHANLATILTQRGRFGEAVEHLATAVQLNPRDGRLLNNLGRALAASNRWDEAIEQYRRALRIAPGLAWAHEGLGEALERRGQTAEAIREYRQAVQLEPEDIRLRERLDKASSTKP
jgi:protein O-mannosyl-transferase